LSTFKYIYYIGYYRLASAQIELQQYDDAEATVTSALTIEPGNEVSESKQFTSIMTSSFTYFIVTTIHGRHR